MGGDSQTARDALGRADPDLVELAAGDGQLLVSPACQGRIFGVLDGELLHRLDRERLAQPRPGVFNNLGGNFLWPAPEGGPFAFNYPPGGGAWMVQPGIAEAPCAVTAKTAQAASVEKIMTLRNRRGTSCRLRFARQVRTIPFPGAPSPARLAALGIRAMSYESLDLFEPLETVAPDRMRLAAWSLEQFPGGPGVTAFAAALDPARAINDAYYGPPPNRPMDRGSAILLPLGGPAKSQVGIRVAAAPRFLGALDTRRDLLVLRETAVQETGYFNIADNEQPGGPDSAADCYSVFDGGPLGFFELETIGAMRLDGDRIGPCELRSRSWLARGPAKALVELLEAVWAVRIGAGRADGEGGGG